MEDYLAISNKYVKFGIKKQFLILTIQIHFHNFHQFQYYKEFVKLNDLIIKQLSLVLLKF